MSCGRIGGDGKPCSCDCDVSKRRVLDGLVQPVHNMLVIEVGHAGVFHSVLNFPGKPLLELDKSEEMLELGDLVTPPLSILIHSQITLIHHDLALHQLS